MSTWLTITPSTSSRLRPELRNRPAAAPAAALPNTHPLPLPRSPWVAASASASRRWTAPARSPRSAAPSRAFPASWVYASSSASAAFASTGIRRPLWRPQKRSGGPDSRCKSGPRCPHRATPAAHQTRPTITTRQPGPACPACWLHSLWPRRPRPCPSWRRTGPGPSGSAWPSPLRPSDWPASARSARACPPCGTAG